MARRLFHPRADLWQPRTCVALRRVESILLLVTACFLLFVFAVWIRSARLEDAPPVIAGITVEAGDTLWGIAERYGDPDEYILKRVHALVQANGMKETRVLQAGQTLVVPVGNKSAKLYYEGRYACRQSAD